MLHVVFYLKVNKMTKGSPQLIGLSFKGILIEKLVF